MQYVRLYKYLNIFNIPIIKLTLENIKRWYEDCLKNVRNFYTYSNIEIIYDRYLYGTCNIHFTAMTWLWAFGTTGMVVLQMQNMTFNFLFCHYSSIISVEANGTLYSLKIDRKLLPNFLFTKKLIYGFITHCIIGSHDKIRT